MFRSSLLRRLAPTAVVFAGLLAYSAVQAPVPAVNEPQYLGKAKRFWDPAWSPGDFFLDSSNPHLVFYVAVGWLTRILSLEGTAWVARVVGYALLAIGWTMLAKRIAGSRWAAAPSAALFLLLASLGGLARSENPLVAFLSSFGSLSGEWLVGGIEGKVFAYALLFAAIAFRLDGRRIAAAACLGGSTSFHPIVGAWAVVCGAAAEVAIRWRSPSPKLAVRRRDWVAPAAVFLLAALPGLIPAALTLGGSDARGAARATYMQVFIRLRHHLDPTEFPVGRYVGYAILGGAGSYLLLSSRRSMVPAHAEQKDASLPPIDRDRWFTAFVLAAASVAVAGIAIGWHSGDAWKMPLRDLRGALLKFYPFRLADVFVPLAFSLAVARFLAGTNVFSRASSSGKNEGRPILIAPFISAFVTVAALATALVIPSPDRNPSRMPSGQLADWVDVARWVREHAPADAVIVSPSRRWGFRWFAERSLYVDYKDSPQDTPGLLEWERRLSVLKHWWELPGGRFAKKDLLRLGEETGGDYLVTAAFPGRFDATPLYENETYRIYTLRP